MFLLPDDYPELEKRIKAVGDVAFVPRRGHTADRVVTTTTLSLPPEKMGKEDLTVYLARSEDLNHVRTVHVPSQNTFVVDPTSSPVVEFHRCYFSGSLLREGRVYFQEHDQKGFATWASRILESVRRGLRRQIVERNAVYISERVAIWISEVGAHWAKDGAELVVPESATKSRG
jgi:hypothetical protein